MKPALAAYLGAALFVIVADILWIGVFMTAQYQAWIGPMMLAQPWLPAGLAFYLLYPVGVVVFAVQPALASGGMPRAVALGALYGLMAYGTYDLSNLATLKGWSVTGTVVDMLWGTVLSAVASVLAHAAARRAARA